MSEEIQSDAGIGQRIRAVRGADSQDEFAAKTGITRKTVGRYESGETIPDGKFLLKLKEEYKADPSWVLLGKISNVENYHDAVQSAVSRIDEILTEVKNIKTQ
jgi:Predicted transcriptional regulator